MFYRHPAWGFVNPRPQYAPSGGGGSFNTFDPATKSAKVNLTGSNLTSTAVSPGGNGCGAFGLPSFAHSTGRYYCEFTIVATAAPSGVGVGIADSTWLADTGFLGENNHSAALFGDGFSSNLDSTTITFIAGNIVGMATDLTNNVIYYTKDGTTWGNAGNPTAGTGGNTISSIGGVVTPWRPAIEIELNADQITANFGASAYAYTKPSGYSDW